MKDIELITRRAKGRSKGALLFVHGISVGAWVWDENFLPYFSMAGYDSHALSLRGNGNSAKSQRAWPTTLCDYADDVRKTVDAINQPLIIVGHSFGGAVVQQWLQLGGSPTAMALLASVPPWGLYPASLRLAFFNPALFLAMAGAGRGSRNQEAIRKGLFSAGISDEVFQNFAERSRQDESPLIAIELNSLRPIAPLPWRRVPTLVMGAGRDQLIPQDEVYRTAAYYGVSPVIISNLAHALMLDIHWEAAARELLGWIERLRPKKAHGELEVA
jgi:pimeloyl-ACP methyl ester carboxylesterase